MNHLKEIKESIQNIADMYDAPSAIFTAFVVDCNADTCTVRCGENKYTGVKLRAINNGDSNHLIVTPKVDSQVIVADLSNGHLRDLCVVQYSQIDKVEISYGEGQTYTIKGKTDEEEALVELCLGTDLSLTLKGKKDDKEASAMLDFAGNSILIEGDADGGVKFNGGGNGGLINTPKLKTQLDKLSDRVDNIESIISNSIPSCSLQPNPSWVTIVQPLFGKPKEDFNSLENPKIKH